MAMMQNTRMIPAISSQRQLLFLEADVSEDDQLEKTHDFGRPSSLLLSGQHPRGMLGLREEEKASFVCLGSGDGKDARLEREK